MIEGAEMLIKNDGFINPKKTITALETFRNESNSGRLFSIEMLEKDEQKTAEIPCTWLHEQYQIWCKSNGFKPMNNVHFGRSLSGYLVYSKKQIFKNGKKITIYTGVRCQEGTELASNLWSETDLLQ